MGAHKFPAGSAIGYVFALVGLVKEEALPHKQPRGEKPHQIEDHPDTELVTALAANAVDQHLEGSEGELTGGVGGGLG
jgi:hypothetical protein